MLKSIPFPAQSHRVFKICRVNAEDSGILAQVPPEKFGESDMRRWYLLISLKNAGLLYNAMLISNEVKIVSRTCENLREHHRTGTIA